ncbi:hypothetical protein HYY75_07455 [bacterium]|nr:hypothetical protein [bacterium]
MIRRSPFLLMFFLICGILHPPLFSAEISIPEWFQWSAILETSPEIQKQVRFQMAPSPMDS